MSEEFSTMIADGTVRFLMHLLDMDLQAVLLGESSVAKWASKNK